MTWINKVILLLIFFISSNGFSQSCSQLFVADYNETYICYKTSVGITESPKCSEIRQQTLGPKNLLRMLSLFVSMNTYYTERYLSLAYLDTPKSRGVKPLQLYGDNLISFLKLNYNKEIYISPIVNDQIWNKDKIHKSFKANPWIELVEEINLSFNTFYLKYIREFNGEIPWELIEKIKLGMRFSDILETISFISDYKCNYLRDKYAYGNSIKRLSHEILYWYFKEVITDK